MNNLLTALANIVIEVYVTLREKLTEAYLGLVQIQSKVNYFQGPSLRLQDNPLVIIRYPIIYYMYSI